MASSSIGTSLAVDGEVRLETMLTGSCRELHGRRLHGRSRRRRALFAQNREVEGGSRLRQRKIQWLTAVATVVEVGSEEVGAEQGGEVDLDELGRKKRSAALLRGFLRCMVHRGSRGCRGGSFGHGGEEKRWQWPW